MRPDQIERLKDLTERLADVFLLEADPAEWPGSGVAPADLSQQERGDRFWSKKNAMATGGVLNFTLNTIKQAGVNANAEGDLVGEREADLDRQISDAEKRAEQAMAQVLKRAKTTT